MLFENSATASHLSSLYRTYGTRDYTIPISPAVSGELQRPCRAVTKKAGHALDKGSLRIYLICRSDLDRPEGHLRVWRKSDPDRLGVVSDFPIATYMSIW